MAALSRRFDVRAPAEATLEARSRGLIGDNPISTPIIKHPSSTERAVFLDTDPLLPKAMVKRGEGEEEKVGEEDTGRGVVVGEAIRNGD